ncbi:hypothetical protein AURDEDRAFT_124557 [Auricularia subglabra TFB-10046 SS5]|nr:hypothetical protein AURDEDRAFT_124557 [Auricularia subglabra TFB-10046 SS5]
MYHSMNENNPSLPAEPPLHPSQNLVQQMHASSSSSAELNYHHHYDYHQKSPYLPSTPPVPFAQPQRDRDSSSPPDRHLARSTIPHFLTYENVTERDGILDLELDELRDEVQRLTALVERYTGNADSQQTTPSSQSSRSLLSNEHPSVARPTAKNPSVSSRQEKRPPRNSNTTNPPKKKGSTRVSSSSNSMMHRTGTSTVIARTRTRKLAQLPTRTRCLVSPAASQWCFARMSVKEVVQALYAPARNTHQEKLTSALCMAVRGIAFAGQEEWQTARQTYAPNLRELASDLRDLTELESQLHLSFNTIDKWAKVDTSDPAFRGLDNGETEALLQSPEKRKEFAAFRKRRSDLQSRRNKLVDAFHALGFIVILDPRWSVAAMGASTTNYAASVTTAATELDKLAQEAADHEHPLKSRQEPVVHN